MAIPIHFNIKRRSELDGRKYHNEPAAGVIRNVTIENVIAHGQGTSAIQGHPDSWLKGIRLNNVRLFVSHAVEAPYESTAAAMTLQYARDVEMKGVELRWEEPHASTWKSGLLVDHLKGLELDDVRIDPAPGSDQPVLMCERRGRANGEAVTSGVDSSRGRQKPRCASDRYRVKSYNRA